MSDKLTRLDINNNVELYPCITEQKKARIHLHYIQKQLFCGFYNNVHFISNEYMFILNDHLILKSVVYYIIYLSFVNKNYLPLSASGPVIITFPAL